MPRTATLSILLASDDDALASGLQQAGAEVKHACDGFEVIRIAAESRPDVVILDATSSGLPVTNIAHWLKLNPATVGIPVVGLETRDQVWGDVRLDARFPRDEAPHHIAKFALEVSENKREFIWNLDSTNEGSFDPLSVSLDLIDLYSDRLRLAGTMMKIASRQHDQRDFDHVIKSVLESAGEVLDSSLVAILIPREKAHYTLVRSSGHSKERIKTLENHCVEKLTQLIGREPEVDERVVFGRRHLESDTDPESLPCNVFGHVIGSSNEPMGYLAGVYPEGCIDEIRFAGLLCDLETHLALLLASAVVINTHEERVGELATILRAAVETIRISPGASVNSKGFLLQFLLIVLDLCEAEQGCIVLLDEETGAIRETAALGCNAAEVLTARLEDGCTLEEKITELSPDQVIRDGISDDYQGIGRLIAPLTLGDKVLGCLVVIGVPALLSRRFKNAVKTLSGLGGYFIYNRCIHQRAIDSAVLEEQLKLAKEIQEDLIPEVHPEIPGYDIHGVSIPAKEVGGDFFDYLPFDDGRLGIAIADVSGKSIPASMLMTMTRALVIAASERAKGPARMLQDVNAHLAHQITHGRFVTAAMLIINKDRLTYGSAGHQPLLVYHADTGEFEDINADGIAMGIVDQMHFDQAHVQLKPGDIALLYTDGLNEAMNAVREEFGYARIREVVRENADRSASELVDALFKAIEAHSDGTDLYDDTTIVAIKRISEEDKDNGDYDEKVQDED